MTISPKKIEFFNKTWIKYDFYVFGAKKFILNSCLVKKL